MSKNDNYCGGTSRTTEAAVKVMAGRKPEEEGHDSLLRTSSRAASKLSVQCYAVFYRLIIILLLVSFAVIGLQKNTKVQ